MNKFQRTAAVAATAIVAATGANACSGALAFETAAQASAFAADPQAVFDAAQDLGDCRKLDRHLERTSGAFATATLLGSNSRSQNTPIYQPDTANTVAWWVKNGGNGLRAVTWATGGSQNRVGPVVNLERAQFVRTSTARFTAI